MKSLAAIAVLAALTVAAEAALYLVPNTPAREVALAWDPSPDAIGPNARVTGYNIYYGVTPRQYTNKVDVGNVLSCTISNLVPGVRYFFTATAHDMNGQESEFCNEVFWLVPQPIAPVPGIRATNATIRVSVEQAPKPKGPWTEFASATTETAFPGYYRSSVSITLPQPTLPDSGVIDYRRRHAPKLPPVPGKS